jgi:hypothetical protein
MTTSQNLYPRDSAEHLELSETLDDSMNVGTTGKSMNKKNVGNIFTVRFFTFHEY